MHCFKTAVARIAYFSSLIAALSINANAADVQPLPPLGVSNNHHYFVRAEGGKPFFWLADTTWGIFNHPTPQELDTYLDDRAAKGFTVIQGAMALWDYAQHPNCDGQLPFVNGDPAQINPAYFTNADTVIDKVTAHGMYMAILPFWTKGHLTGNYLQTTADPQKMHDYCKFLTQRYAKRNIFWILGGDWPGQAIQPLVDAEAAGLIEGAKAAGVEKIMISYHPTGRQSSSFWFQARDWLDFDSIQSGHFINTTNFQIVGNDYVKTPIKPTLDMEPGYENITNNLIRNNPNAPRIQAVDVRRSAYLAVFAGAAGHSYGNAELYTFAPPTSRPVGYNAGIGWRESMNLPASGQVQFVRYLIESRPQLDRVPDQSLVYFDGAATQPTTRAVDRYAAMRGSDGSYAFIYLPAGKSGVTVNTAALTGATLTAWWYDPRTGKASQIDSVAKVNRREFGVPAEPAGMDWVLVIDDAAKNYPAPGTH